jgi:hypothetical protein
VKTRGQIKGWSSWQGQTADGAVESQQRAILAVAVVEFSEQGALALGERYWQQVERSTRGLVRIRGPRDALELRVLGHWPLLLRFGRPKLEASSHVARCSYPIQGGVLAQRCEGEISFAQMAKTQPEITSTIRNFFPRLAARAGRPHWTGALYNFAQSRVHVAISQRYFVSLTQDVDK